MKALAARAAERPLSNVLPQWPRKQGLTDAVVDLGTSIADGFHAEPLARLQPDGMGIEPATVNTGQ